MSFSERAANRLKRWLTASPETLTRFATCRSRYAHGSGLVFLLLAALTLTPVHAAVAAVDQTWHVAPAPVGADTNDGSATAPFASIERARLAVREHLASHTLNGDLVVQLRGGEYELASPLRFSPADSGKDGFNVIYRATPGADVILSGGRRVTGWSRDADGTYRADVGRDVDFRQLWIDGRRAIRARTPNLGRTFRLATEKQVDGFDLPRAQLADVKLHPNEIEVSVLIAWMHKRLRIARLADSPAPDMTRAVIAAGEWDAVTNQPQGDRKYLGREYWLENAREFLDAPGEFFVDRRAGTLLYRPRPGEDLTRLDVRVVRPELENLIVLDGQLDAPVHHLRFEGLTFAYSGWTRPNHFGFVDVQANSLVPRTPAEAVDPQYRHNQRKERVPAAFQAITSDHIVMRGCRFARLGGTGVIFTHGGNDNVIEGNSFVDLAAGGIEIGEDAARPANARLFPRRNLIANNLLAHVGEDYFGSVAILGYYTDASVITHNEIAALPYTAISQGWGWGNPPAPPDSRANKITHNHISNFMRRVDDGGGIYTTDRQLESEIAFNFIEQMLPPDIHTKAGGAIYPDQFTEGLSIHDNVVAESIRWIYIWNPNIRGNLVERNFADTANWRHDAPDNRVEPAKVFADRRWPEAARDIIASAGIAPAFAYARDFFAPQELIVESTSVDFQILQGEWAASDALAERYGGTYQESTDADAAARWQTQLPQEGSYEIAVWRPAGSAATRYAVEVPDGESRVVTLPANSTAGWENIGETTVGPRRTVSVIVRRGAASGDVPVRADAVRFTWRRQ